MAREPVTVEQQAASGGLRRYLPIVGRSPVYRREWFAPDAIAALSVWALLVPQALGYARSPVSPCSAGSTRRTGTRRSPNPMWRFFGRTTVPRV